MSHSKNDFPIMGGTGRQVTKPYRGSYDAFYKLINPNTKKPYTNAELAAELEHRQQEYPVLAQLITPDLEEIQRKARSHPNAEFKLARRGKSRKKAEELLHQEAYPILERIAKLLFRPLWKSNLKCGNVTVRDYVHFMGDTLYADKSLKEAASLRSCINRIILPMIGDIQLHQLSPDRQKAIVQRLNKVTKLSGYTGLLDSLLRQGVKNSSVVLERLKQAGFEGGATIVKEYIAAHKHLIPARRQLVAPQGNRGRRYVTKPGEAYQMDWGFADVLDYNSQTYRVACFAMICHHCGQRYIEFFPNARQENLFIGMIHAFQYMGVPRFVLTDNMKSVVLHRDLEGHPVWQKDYETFMQALAFETKLCKPRHPFTKGKVERLVRFVKDNFLADRVFCDLTDLNWQALEWCNKQNGTYRRKASELRDRFTAARRSGKTDSCLNGLVRPSCLIIDEIVHCAFDKENTRLFFDLIDRRYNKEGSFNMIFTSNKNPALWREDFEEDATLLCTLDRIFDDATVFKLRGESFRGKKLETVSLQTGRVPTVEPAVTKE